MVSERFITEIEDKLVPLAPIMIPGVIKKQLKEVGATRADLTEKQAQEFVERVADALTLFIGPEGSRKARAFMIKKFNETIGKTEYPPL